MDYSSLITVQRCEDFEGCRDRKFSTKLPVSPAVSRRSAPSEGQILPGHWRTAHSGQLPVYRSQLAKPEHNAPVSSEATRAGREQHLPDLDKRAGTAHALLLLTEESTDRGAAMPADRPEDEARAEEAAAATAAATKKKVVRKVVKKKKGAPAHPDATSAAQQPPPKQPGGYK